MAEYLSPGVYVEELESGSKPMEGVGTSTAGFVGLAERGPVGGIPQLVTSAAEFKRTYGGYLSENAFGEYRFLAYAVDQFFINGGSRAFIVRVAPSDGVCSTGSNKVLNISAKNPGTWGDDIQINVAPTSKAKTQILEVLDTDAGKRYIVKNGDGFNSGDVVAFNDGETVVYNKVVKNQGNILTLANDLDDSCVDKELIPTKVLTTCEFSLDVRYGDVVEVYDNLNFNINTPNYVDKKLSKSDLINVTYVGEEGDEIQSPFEMIAGADKAVASLVMSGGKDGDHRSARCHRPQCTADISCSLRESGKPFCSSGYAAGYEKG